MSKEHYSTDTPDVSVLMPVFNAERYIDKAMESIMHQEFIGRFELIVIDDGSTDGSLARLRRWAAHDSRVRLAFRENRGFVATLNEGLRLVRSPFVARMDADDMCKPNRLQKQLDFMRVHPECVAVGTSMSLIDGDGAPLGTMENPSSHDEIDALHLKGRAGALAHATAVMRLAALEHVGGYRSKFVEVAEDFDLFLRLAEVGQLANIPEPLYLYRLHEQSLCHRSSRHVENRCLALQDAFLRRGIESDLPNLLGLDQPVDRRPADLYHSRTWMALQSGFMKTARKYALKGLVKSPFQLKSYGLLWRAFRR